MKLSESLVLYAEWWVFPTNKPVDFEYPLEAAEHLLAAYDMIPIGISYLCLLEAEYQKDIENEAEYEYQTQFPDPTDIEEMRHNQ